MAEIEVNGLVGMVMYGRANRELYAAGMPAWLHVTPSKAIEALKILRSFNEWEGESAARCCGYAGVLQASVLVACVRCNGAIEPDRELFLTSNGGKVSGWHFNCVTCNAEVKAQDAERTAAYVRMVAERNRATAERRAKRFADLRAAKRDAVPEQLELLSGKTG